MRQDSIPTESLLEKISSAADSVKALDIDIIDLRGKSSETDYFLVCSATSSAHAKGIYEKIRYTLKQEHITEHHPAEGLSSAEWVLIDYSSVIVHIFVESIRSEYDFRDIFSISAERMNASSGALEGI